MVTFWPKVTSRHTCNFARLYICLLAAVTVSHEAYGDCSVQTVRTETRRKTQNHWDSSNGGYDTVGYVSNNNWSSERWRNCFNNMIDEIDNWVRTHSIPSQNDADKRRFIDKCTKCCIDNDWAMNIYVSLRIDYGIASYPDRMQCVKNEGIPFIHNSASEINTLELWNDVTASGNVIGRLDYYGRADWGGRCDNSGCTYVP